MGLFVDKGSGSGIFLDPDPDPGDPKRRDPTGSGSATLLVTINLSPAFQNFFPEVIFIFTLFLGYFTLDHSPNIFYRPDIHGFRGLVAVFNLEMKGVRNCLQSGFSSVD